MRFIWRKYYLILYYTWETSNFLNFMTFNQIKSSGGTPTKVFIIELDIILDTYFYLYYFI